MVWILTISWFYSIVGNWPFGFPIVVGRFRFGAPPWSFCWWCCRRRHGRYTTILIIILFTTITVIDATYSNCYWITFRWHSITLYEKRSETEKKKSPSLNTTNHERKTAFSELHFDWFAQLLVCCCLFWNSCDET